MKITGETELESVLQIDEEKMLETLAWLAPELGRLQCPTPRRSTLGSVTVQQAARIARIPLLEMLYVLNLAAGEDEKEVSAELRLMDCLLLRQDGTRNGKPRLFYR